MVPGVLNTALKSLAWYKKQVLYQVIIIALLCAVITGSLLTGYSVRQSLKRTASGKLGNTGIVISTGTRFFNPVLVTRLRERSGYECAGLLEMQGNATVLGSQKSANVKIFATGDDFYSFTGNGLPALNDGEIAINQRLAGFMQVKAGDDIILRLPGLSDIPSDAPFAPSDDEGISFVLRVGSIIGTETGNFSLTISQITPMNIFLKMSDLENIYGKKLKFNRMLLSRHSGIDITRVHDDLKMVMEPSDIGLKIRVSVATGEPEIVTDRIFIDEALTSAIDKIIPSSYPVITYLANDIKASSGSTPYSFVSGLHLSEGGPGRKIIINKWLAEDRSIMTGDSLTLTWYSPDSLNHLAERSGVFVVSKVVSMEGIWADSLLMPEFPGIAGSESCSRWDAGIPVETGRIRKKDEEYWNRYRGTPKAFIDYSTAKEIWGSNYGPATSIRFTGGTNVSEISDALKGNLDPDITGFFINDIYRESLKAADESVDFGSLFISLGFFLIVASIVLLSFTVSYYFDLKKNDTGIYFALGFRNSLIMKILLTESVITAVTGCVAGAFAGYFVNMIITKALNTVWSGAVQTDTLRSFFALTPVVAGCAASLAIIMIMMLFKIWSVVKKLASGEESPSKKTTTVGNLILLFFFTLLTAVFIVSALMLKDREIMFFFLAGSSLLITFILLFRNTMIRTRKRSGTLTGRGLSSAYYSFHPSHALAPVLFIAAGLFAFFITTVNRKSFDKEFADRKSGTGGYLLWSETTIPVSDDLSTLKGRKAMGLDDDSLSSLSFVQMKRYAGNDASCLNLNHITAPPLLGADAGKFLETGAFSFASSINKTVSPWEMLGRAPVNNTFYGVADQTVLDWGLKLKTGDTLRLRAENGQPINIVIAGGLQSSVFQGYVIIGKKNFSAFFPSVAGHTVFLADGDRGTAAYYLKNLRERFSLYGIEAEETTERLASFYRVTNTYLSVFGVFGGLGLAAGIAGLGFVLLRNYNRRKKEYALMMATGFSSKSIRKMIFSDQVRLITAGILSGLVPAIIATVPSLRSNHEIPWLFLGSMILIIFLTGLAAVYLSLLSVKDDSLITALRRD